MVQFARLSFDRKDKAPPPAVPLVIAIAVSAQNRVKASRRAGKVHHHLAGGEMNSPLVYVRCDAQWLFVDGIPIDAALLRVYKQVALVRDGGRLPEEFGPHPAACFVSSARCCRIKLMRRRAKTA